MKAPSGEGGQRTPVVPRLKRWYHRAMRPPATLPAPRQRRIALRQEATLINSSGRAFPVFVKDLSRAGFALEHRSQDLRLGEIVIIRSHRGTEARCEIRWTTEFEAGGVFIELPRAPG